MCRPCRLGLGLPTCVLNWSRHVMHVITTSNCLCSWLCAMSVLIQIRHPTAAAAAAAQVQQWRVPQTLSEWSYSGVSRTVRHWTPVRDANIDSSCTSGTFAHITANSIEVWIISLKRRSARINTRMHVGYSYTVVSRTGCDKAWIHNRISHKYYT